MHKRSAKQSQADACLSEVQALLKRANTTQDPEPTRQVDDSCGSNALSSRLRAEQSHLHEKNKLNEAAQKAENAMAQLKKLLKLQVEERMRLLEKRAEIAEELIRIRKKQVDLSEDPGRTP